MTFVFLNFVLFLSYIRFLLFYAFLTCRLFTFRISTRLNLTFEVRSKNVENHFLQLKPDSDVL